MSTDVGVLCTRVRLEEKRLIAALAAAGCTGLPVPPTDSPLPLQPLAIDLASGDRTHSAPSVLIDRLADRTIAQLLTPFWWASAGTVIGAGHAAVLDRLGVARLLANANLPRPETILVLTEDSGLIASTGFGDLATLLPLAPGSPELPLLDREIAEAVLEHRAVLGKTVESTALVQAGIAAPGNRAEVMVVDGVAIAISGTCQASTTAACAALAEHVALVLNANLLGVTITWSAGQLVVWDVTAVPEFREATPIAGVAVEAAIADLAVRLAVSTPNMQVQHAAGEVNHAVLSA